MKHLTLMLRTVAAWLVTLLVVFPLIWLVLTAFKTEQQAISVPLPSARRNSFRSKAVRLGMSR